MATPTDLPAQADAQPGGSDAPSTELPPDEVLRDPPESDAAAEAERRAPLPWRTIALGTAGTVLLMLSAVGAGGTLIHDPLIGTGPLSAIRYGHGKMLATATLYIGFALVVWAWVRLGRHVLAGRVAARPVLLAAVCWAIPMLFSPPVFTRDVFSYLAQGAQALHGFDPYAAGPVVLNDYPDLVQNVHPFWQNTPAPYGPLFLLIAKGVAAVVGQHMIIGVILMRLVLVPGLVLTVWALRGLVHELGGKMSVTMWLAFASPMTVVHLIGGPHNDMLMLGFLTSGTLLTLRRKHWAGIALATLAMAIKPTAAMALPFLVLVWAAHLPDEKWGRRFLKALAPSLGIFVGLFAALTWVAQLNLGWIVALRAPAMVENWLSAPTALGEIVHSLVRIFVDTPIGFYTIPARVLGGLVLAYVGVKQWLRSRDGGPDAVKRMALILFLTAALSPVTMPWYLMWGFVIATAMAWQRRHLAIIGALSVFLVLTYTPGGEDLLYDWWFMACAAALSVLAGVSLLRPDPLGLFTTHHEDPEADKPVATR
ncbi:polyprenol phosphomannose-dependent alpha 1,6 mannosyltransferase MptB [Labedaea rhizosphaerae]|uniref:Alpha-1,6-mannosyltransferase n=1 Tax=Labedaea rhizosphaerae TaxID=598644 RepID=A0A4V3CXQ3_LABRH|nr:polyprenol phosphomannose-dependent alpha 1,6 mannosyltransferase MptB [Labedaea rhizosphaerae]TDP91158.1 alpha-1,6-mannosyltransferase [Labedaea rhizosphaerae]